VTASATLQSERRAAGLCPLDGNPVKPGRARCAYHCARAVAYRRKYRQRAARALLCQETSCGALAVAGETRCAACKAVEKIKAAARYEAMKAAGRCVMRGCGRAVKKGRVVCGLCLREKRRKYAEIRGERA